MTTAKAIRIHAFGGAEVLRHEDIEAPAPAAGEVLVRVHAAGVNPVDWKVRSGYGRGLIPGAQFPITLGGDLAGTVEAVGPGVTAFAPGAEVFGLIGLIGAYAGLVATKAEYLARKPRSLDFVQAASVPLAALTAWQALFDTAALQAGQSVLIHAGAGGVGLFAVQLARWAGVRVTATASPANAAYLHQLGAAAVIDYRSTPVEAMPGDFDMVFDLAGGDTAVRSMPLLKPGGIVVVAAGRPAPREPDDQGRRLIGIIVKPSGAKLEKIGALIDTGQLRTEIAAVFPLSQAAAAHALSELGHTRGKIVLKMDD